MHVTKFLNNPGIHLPRTRETDDFGGFTNDTLSRFLSLLDEIDEPGTLASKIAALRPSVEAACECLCDAVNAALHGQPHTAYDRFLAALEHLEPHLRRIVNDPSRHQYFYRL